MNAREDAPVTHLEYLLTAYLFESLSEAGRREVEEHLGRCPACRRELEELRATLGMVRDVIAPGSAPALAQERLEAILSTRPSRGFAGVGLERWGDLGHWASQHRRALAAAAVALISLGIFAFAILQSGLKARKGGVDLASAPPEISTPFELADGQLLRYRERSRRCGSHQLTCRPFLPAAPRCWARESRAQRAGGFPALPPRR